MGFGEGVMLYSSLFSCVEVLPEILAKIGITDINESAPNAAGHQRGIYVDDVFPESFIVATDSAPEIIVQSDLRQTRLGHEKACRCNGDNAGKLPGEDLAAPSFRSIICRPGNDAEAGGVQCAYHRRTS